MKQKTIKCSNKLLCEKISPFTSDLPSQTLGHYIQTNDLLQEWLKVKYAALLFGESLKARFMRGGGNPAKRALNDGYLDNIGYEVHMAWVSFCASEFTLYQTAWEEIFDSFKHLEDSPKDEVSLFFDGIKQHYDNKFLCKANGGKSSIKNFESYMKLLRDILKRHQNNRNWTGELSSQDTRTINKVLFNDRDDISNIQSQPSWGYLAFRICEETAKQDGAVLRALRQYYNDLLWLTSLNVDSCQSQRKNISRSRWSESWKDGQQLLRTSSGYKPTSAVGTKVLPIPELLRKAIY
ncbi:MAG: hypothetical protein SWZ49_10070 [Cyanobacteriota bacterium]|nr:hypothetical protein [Cyanobacteriota bacterium]